ncbi:hypothetical protein MKX03_027942, partial [Papaver bracteatum]
ISSCLVKSNGKLLSCRFLTYDLFEVAKDGAHGASCAFTIIKVRCGGLHGFKVHTTQCVYFMDPYLLHT